MVWWAALTTTTGSGVIVETAVKVNARMAVGGRCFGVGGGGGT